MSVGEIAYLLLVLAAMAGFAGVLAWSANRGRNSFDQDR